MYLFAILSSLLCIQLISTVLSDTSDASQSSQSNILTQTPTILEKDDSESAEEYVYVPRSTTFLRFGRAKPNRATFLRFGRQIEQPASSNFLRFGRKGEFLRFG